MKPQLFWVDGQVVECTTQWPGLIPHALFLKPCCDPNAMRYDHQYGVYHGGMPHSWEHVPLEEFPKEFQMILLLLGVT